MFSSKLRILVASCVSSLCFSKIIGVMYARGLASNVEGIMHTEGFIYFMSTDFSNDYAKNMSERCSICRVTVLPQISVHDLMLSRGTHSWTSALTANSHENLMIHVSQVCLDIILGCTDVNHRYFLRLL